MDEEKTTELKNSERPKDARNWGTSGCPLIIFGDDEAAEYDIKKMKKFFSRFKKKQKDDC